MELYWLKLVHIFILKHTSIYVVMNIILIYIFSTTLLIYKIILIDNYHEQIPVVTHTIFVLLKIDSSA